MTARTRAPKEQDKPSLSKPPLLTPHRKDGEERRCAKREVIISARVHPGETPAQFVVDGHWRPFGGRAVGQAARPGPTCGGSCLV